MKRGELRLAAAGAGYVGKPRPVLILQDDALSGLDSVVVCPLSISSPVATPLRIAVPASETTGLDADSVIMVDKVSAVPKRKIRERIGAVDNSTLRQVIRGVATLVGMGH